MTTEFVLHVPGRIDRPVRFKTERLAKQLAETVARVQNNGLPVVAIEMENTTTFAPNADAGTDYPQEWPYITRDETIEEE